MSESRISYTKHTTCWELSPIGWCKVGDTDMKICKECNHALIKEGYGDHYGYWRTIDCRCPDTGEINPVTGYREWNREAKELNAGGACSHWVVRPPYPQRTGILERIERFIWG